MSKKEEPEVLQMNVSRSWIRLIRFVQVNIPYGQICFKIANSEPTDLVQESTKKKVRFDKEETLPIDFSEF